MLNLKNDCDYIAHDNGIHDFVFHKPTRQSVDFLMDNMGDILLNTPIDDPLLTIVDLTESGLPPLRYAMTRSKEVNNGYFREHMEQKQHVAYLAMISTNSLIQTFKIFVEQMARGNTKIKICGDRESAVAWLLSKKEIAR